MSIEYNKALIRRFYEEAVNAHNPGAIDRFVVPTIIDHELGLSGTPPRRRSLGARPRSLPACSALRAAQVNPSALYSANSQQVR
jgi:hypothetical protein